MRWDVGQRFWCLRIEGVTYQVVMPMVETTILLSYMSLSTTLLKLFVPVGDERVRGKRRRAAS